MIKQKFKSSKKDKDYDYISLSLFKGDKADLIVQLNKSKTKYSSLSHFIRCAINTELEALKIKFNISEQ